MAGSEDLRLPDHLREGILKHVEDLRRAFAGRDWGHRAGFGERPALIVIDFAMGWTDTKLTYGSNLDEAVENTVKVLEVAREQDIPIFFTVMAYDASDAPGPFEKKLPKLRTNLAIGSEAVQLDPRLGRRPTEKLIVKKHTSSFRGTNLHEMLNALNIDTLIVTGCSTSHCVYETCDDAMGSFHVIVPEGTIGDRCELFHLVEMLDIDLTLGDVVPLEEALSYLRRVGSVQQVAKAT